MRKIYHGCDLLNAIHNKKIIVNYSGTKMEVTEKAFLDAINMDRNDFEIDIYTVKVGDNTLAVIQNIILRPKSERAIPKPIIRNTRGRLMAALSILN